MAKILVIDDPMAEKVRSIAKELAFWDPAKSGDKTVVVTVSSRRFDTDPTRHWFAHIPAARGFVACGGPALAWKCPICQMITGQYARYFRAALARMEDWQT